MFCLIKKSWPVLNNKFVIPFFIPSLSHFFLSLSLSLQSFLRAETQKANPRRPQLHCRQRRSTATLRGRRILSPPKSQPHAVLISIDAKEDPPKSQTQAVLISTKKPNPSRPHLHWRQRRSMAGLHGRRISSPPSTFEDRARDRAFVAADPSLEDPGSNLFHLASQWVFV